MFLGLTVSFINGIIIMLCINHFKINKKILLGGLIGLISFLLFFGLKKEFPQLVIFIRILLWTFVSFLVYRKNFPNIKYDYVIFRILILILVKMVFEKIIFNGTQKLEEFSATLYSLLPLIFISFLFDIATQIRLLNKLTPNLIKFIITIMSTSYLVYAYWFILKNF